MTSDLIKIIASLRGLRRQRCSAAVAGGHGLSKKETCHQPQTSVIALVRREAADGLVVALLGVSQGEAGVDLQGLAGGVADSRCLALTVMSETSARVQTAEWTSPAAQPRRGVDRTSALSTSPPALRSKAASLTL